MLNITGHYQLTNNMNLKCENCDILLSNANEEIDYNKA